MKTCPLSAANETLLHGAQTIDELKARIVRYSSKFRPVVTAVVAPNPVVTRPRAPAATADTTEATTRCYNCTKLGHYQSRCPYETRPSDTCFKCWQTGHRHTACTNPRKTLRLKADIGAANRGPAAAEEPDMIALMEAVNVVSVAFVEHQNQCTEYIECPSLFDTGSPISFIRRNAVSFNIPDALTSTGLRALGGAELFAHGIVNCLIKFNGRCRQIKLTVVPTESMLLPLVLGRDFLSVFQIRLGQPRLIYDRDSLLELGRPKLVAATDADGTCALNSECLTRCRLFDPFRAPKPMRNESASHCNSTDSTDSTDSMIPKNRFPPMYHRYLPSIILTTSCQ